MTHQANNLKMMKMRFNILATLVMLFTLAVGQSWGISSVVKNGNTTTITWDFSEYTENTQATNKPYNSTDSKLSALIVNTGTAMDSKTPPGFADFVGKSGFHPNGASNTSTRFLKYTPSYSGSVTVTYISNNSTATNRIVAIGKSVKTGSDIDALKADENVLEAGLTDGYTKKSITAELTAGTDYYFYNASGGCTIQKIVYVYEESSDPDPDPVDDEELFKAKATTAYSVPGNTTTPASLASYATISGGEMFVVSAQTEAKNLVTANDFQMTNGNTFFKITLSKALKEKDRIDVKIKQNTAARGIWLHEFVENNQYPNSGGIKILTEGTDNGKYEDCTYTIKSGDYLIGKTEIYIYRATGNGTNFQDFTITRPGSNPSPEPAPEWETIEMTLNEAGLLTTEDMTEVDGKYPDVEFGISVDGSGNVIRVAKDAQNAIGVISGKYHSDHGMLPFSMTLKVPGAVRITAGICEYGATTIKVNDVAAGETAGGQKGDCWKNNHDKVATGIYAGSAGEITITTGTYTPYIKVEKLTAIPYTVTFSKGSIECEGTLLPENKEVLSGESIKIPVNTTLYKEGHTLTGWSDGENTYAVGSNFTPTKNTAFTPVFTENTDNLADRNTEVTLNWDFQTNQSAPLVGYEGNKGFLVTQTTVNGNAIDVKLDIDATSGKFNTSNGDWAQVNPGLKFTIPSATGAVVSMYIMNDPGSTTTVDEQSYDSFTSNTATWTIAGSKTSVDAILNDGSWYKWLKVILPAARVATPVISDDNGNVTITCATDGAAIYYTTDDSEPTSASTLYNNTFTLENNATVKAIAIKDGLTNSKVASKDVTGSSSVTHTWDFTKWSEATKTQVIGASDWTTKESDSKNYITGNEIRWNNEAKSGTLKANGAVISELEGLQFNNLAQYGLGIAFNYQTTIDANKWGPYNSPSYLWVMGSSSSITVPNVKAGSTFKVGSESHKPSEARGFNVTVNGSAVASSTGTSTSADLTEFTYTIPDDEKGYVDVVLTATKGCHLYYIDAETVEPPMEWRDIKMEFCGEGSFIRTVQTEQWGDINTGIAVAEDGTVSAVPVDDPTSRATLVTKYHGTQYGLGNSLTMTVDVPGPVKISFGSSYYAGSVTVSSGNGFSETIKSYIEPANSVLYSPSNPQVVTCTYEGEATTLTITTSGDAYCPYIAIESYTPFGPSADGYYIVSTTEELLRALDEASRTATSEETRVKIFLKKGTYDLGTKTLTNVTSYVSLIGEDREGTIICNQPTVEGIGVTATLKPTGSHIYMQDLSLRCTVGYDSGTQAGRGVALQDVGNYNVYKNVGLLSNQDTYYSNGGNDQKSYFENCYITGTVDYICGGGDIWFEKTTLYNNARSSGDVIAAPATAASTQWGYVFNNCIVDGDAGQAGRYNLGRDWQGSPACTFMNTIFKILPSAAAYTNMSKVELKLRFHEYNNKDSRGNLVTSHNLNSMLGGSKYTSQLYLTEQQAAQYTLDNVFDSWNPASLTAQASTEGTVQDGSVLTFPAEGIYLIEKDGEFVTIVEGSSYTMPDDGKYTVRRANEMGGFGPKSDVYTTRQGEIAWSDFKMELMTEGILTSDYSYWVSDGKGGLTKTGASESHYLVKMKGEYHNDHGYRNLVVRFKAPGTVKIGVGGCQYSKNNTTINTLADIDAAAGTQAGVIDANASCYHGDKKFYTYDYTGDEAFIEIKGAAYVPAISVKSTGDIPVAEGKWIRYKNQDFENAEKKDDNWTSAADDRYFSSQNVRSGDSHYVLYNAGSTNGTTFTYNGIPAVGSKYTDAEVYKVEFDAGLVPVNTSGSAQTQSFKIMDLSGNELCNWTLTVPANSSPKDTDGDIMIGGESVAKFTATRPTPTFYHIEIVGGTPAGTTMKVTDVNGNVNTYTLSNSSVKIGNLTYATGKSNGGLALDNLKVLVYNDIPEYTVDLPETVEAKTGFRTKLTVEAEGAVGYQWYKNTEASLTGGEPIEGATDMTYSFTPTEEGTEYYYVKAWNKFGTTVSHLATVNITKAIPEITKLEFGSFDFSKKKFKVYVEGIGDIHLSFDGGEYIDYDEEDQSNVYALNTVTAYATTVDGQSMPVTLTQPIEYDTDKPFAAWIYTKSYVNSTTKAEMDKEAQNQPITRKIREICNLINVEFPDESKVYGQTHPSLNRADLIVFSEMVVGGTTLANSFEQLIGNVPFLNFKAYNYGIEKSRWKWGEPGQEDDYTAINVNAVNPWLKMFDGVNIIDNSAEPSADNYGKPVFEVCDKDNGSWNDAIKHLQWIDGTSLSSTLPTVKVATTFTNYAEVHDNKIFMHGFDPVQGVDALAPYILFALNFDNAQAASDDAITIAGNLAAMMLNGESFGTKTAGVAPTITDNGDGSAHITTNIYKGNIYYKVLAADAAAPESVDGTWTEVDAEGNTEKQVAGEYKVYAAVKFPSELTDQPDGFAPTGYSIIGSGILNGTNIRVIKFAEGTEDVLDGDEANHKYMVPSKYSRLSVGAEVNIDDDYKIPMNVYMVKAEPGKEDEPVRPYYRFAGWTADQAVTAMTRNDRPADFDPLNPTYPIPYPQAQKPEGTLLGTTTFVKMPANDLTFTSQFFKNKVSLANASAPTLVTWDFTTGGSLYDRGGSAGSYTEGTYTQDHLGSDVWPSEPMNVENDAYYYNRLAHVRDLSYPDEMSQLEFSYRYIDVPLFMDSRNVTGANNQIFNVTFNNTESTDYAKTTERMIFGIPAVYGMQIKLIGNNSDGKVTTFNKETSKTTIGGEAVNAAEHKLLSNIENENDAKGNPLLKMTYLGKNDYLYVDLNEGQSNGEIYMKGISVIYPARVNITPKTKLGDDENAGVGKIFYKPIAEETELTEATPFTVGVADTLVAKAAYGYKFVGWYDGETIINTGITDITKDGKNNVIESQLVYTPTATTTISAKFAAIDKVKVQVTTYRNTPADIKPEYDYDEHAKNEVNEQGEYGSFVLTTTQLGETVEFTPEYNNEVNAYEIDVTPGTIINIQAVQVPGNRFNHMSKWTYADGVWTEDELSIINENPATITAGEADTKYYVQFEDVSGGFIVKYNSDGGTDIVPSQNGMFNFAAPRYHTLFTEGQSLLGWKDAKDTKYFIYQYEEIGSNAVEVGQVMDELPLLPKETVVMDDDLVLTPIFAKNNSFSKLPGRKEGTTVTWDFTTNNRAQLLNFSANQSGKYVARAAVKAGDNKFYSCDVPMTFETGKRGRINNTTSDTWCSIGNGTKFTIPVCKGATITMDVRNKITSTTFAGEVPTDVMVQYRGSGKFTALDPENKTAIDCYRYSYTYQGDENEADIIIGADYSYYRKLSVTLPAVEQKHEETLMYSDLTDLAAKYNYSYSNKKATFRTLGINNETITMDLGSVNVYPTSTMAASSQYVGGEKGYIHATNAAEKFSMYGFNNLTRICYRYGARIANGWKVTAFEDKNGNHILDKGETEIVLVADKKTTTPEWVEINDIYLENPVVTFYNISYLEKNVDKVTSSGPYDAYLFNLELYGIANTTDALNTLEVGNKAMAEDKEVPGGEVWIDPYTLCLPTDDELTQFHTATVRPVEGLEHYQTPRRKMQFNEGTEVKLTAMPEVGFDFTEWTDEEGNTVSTKNPYTFTIHDNVKYIANYRQIGHIYYTFGSQNLEGSLPAEQQTSKQQFTVHQNRTIANSLGQTLSYWINAQDPTEEKKAEGVTQAHYVPTKTYTYSEDNDHFTGFDVYLEPVFLDNSFSLLDIEEPVSVKWPFGYKGGAPEFNIEQRAGFEIAQAYLNADQFIDLRMDIDCTKQPNGKYGKVNNAGRTDDAAQVNQNTVFTFPMTKGMKLEVNTDKSLTASLVGGSKPYSSGKTSVFYPSKKDQGSDWIDGNEVATTQLYINDGNQNFSSIVATYYPRLKQPVLKLTGTPNTTSATISVTRNNTSGAINEKVYYTMSTDGTDPVDPTNSSTELAGNSIPVTFTDGKPVIIKAMSFAENRPDSKVVTYIVSPYDESKNTAVYLYDSSDKAYNMGGDIVYKEMVNEFAGTYNVVAYDLSSGAPTGEALTIVKGEKVKAYVTSDIDKSKASLVNTESKPVVSLQNVLDGIVTWTVDGTEFELNNTNKDNLAIFDKVLIAYNETKDVNDCVCVSNTGQLRHSDVNYNAAYIIANATKAVMEGNPTKTWATTETDQPQVRKQKFAGNYVSANGLGLLAGGETSYPVPVWSDRISVAAVAEEGTGYIGYVQPTTGSMDAKVMLYRDEAKQDLIREYTIHLIIETKVDGLVYTEVDNGTAEEGWNNGTWNISQEGKAMGGNDGECFKINCPTRLTITGPANYGIKSVTFRGYDFVGAAPGGGQISGFTAQNVDASPSKFTSMEASTIKKYNNNEYQQHVDGDLKLIYPLGSTNSTTIDLSGASQYIGSIIVEYYERMTSEISITGADFGGNDFANLTMPHNGHFSLTFNSQMAAVTTLQENKVQISDGNTTQAVTAAGDNSTLTFYYWGLQPGDYTLTVPYAALNDIYNTPFTGNGIETVGLSSYVHDNVLTIPFTVAPMNFERKVMDFIVDDVENGITWDGTHIEALETLGDVNDGKRHVIYLPNRTEANRYFIEANGTRFTDSNSRTRLRSSNLSIVGESQKGVIWANHPAEEGSSSTPTLEFMEKSNKDNYMQDITIRNEWPYNASNFAGRATCLLDNGTNTILKNVKMDSWQDSYYTQGVRGYNEDCTIMGVVDFIYGHGDYWFQNCDIIVRDRVGNNITAPNTSAGEKWGYVFMDCKIDKEEGASLVADGTFTLGRPWNNSPAATFINTTMYVKPTKAGWQQMETGVGKVLRLHEYNSLNPDGTPISLAGRSVAGMSPAAGSFAAVMTEAQAAEYTLHDVLGGDNGFDPTEHTKQIPRITDAYIDGQTLYWNDRVEARSYNVYYLGDGETADMENPILIANITDNHYNLFDDHVFRTSDAFSTWYDSLSKTEGKIRKHNDTFTHGWFAIRAANQRGGLNEISNAVEYHKVHEYKTIVSVGGKEDGDDSGNVWSTIYLDFNAKVPRNVKAYALTDVTAFGGTDVTETTVHLKRVSINETTEENQDIIYANMGYILYGPGPEHRVPMTNYHFVETGHMNIVSGTEEESRDAFMKSYLRGTVGEFKGTTSDGVGETGIRGWSRLYSDYSDVPVGYTTAYTLATKTVENVSFGLGFYKYRGDTFAHHKAYLDTDDVSNLLKTHGLSSSSIDELLSKGFRIMFHNSDDVVTKVVQVNSNTVDDLSDSIYNTLGQKIRPEMMRKGEVYIINGKKVRY